MYVRMYVLDSADLHMYTRLWLIATLIVRMMN